MKILVTGGSGYVGSVLVPALLRQGYRVKVFDNLLFKQTSLLPHFINPLFEFVHGDVRDVHALARAVEDVDLIIHLAAIVGAPICSAHPELAEAVNYQGTVNLDSVRSSHQPIIYASTGSNYGKVDGICTEDTPLHPLSVYGQTKTKAEEHLKRSGNMIGFRFATAFGISPRLRLDLMPNDFALQALRVGNLIVYQKQVRRTFIHVTDMTRAFLHAIQHYEEMKNEIYNVGHERMNLTKEEVALLVKKFVNYYLHFAEIGSDPDQRDYEVSYEKIRSKGFETQVSMEEGIREVVSALKLLQPENPYSNISI
ncbi:NAD(P)-dependent oxidoreductase [Candidatus Uhrbacteria bacterium]|nr:NAD(P)-dependent oxidoreductase [Candidatus Uhrbacteria bacterium]